MKKFFIFVITSIMMTKLSFSKILDDDRHIDWTKAGYNGGGSIPVISSQTYKYFNVKDYGAKANGVDDDFILRFRQQLLLQKLMLKIIIQSQ
jgi:hypothetical protein